VTREKIFSSLAQPPAMIHIEDEASGERGSRPPVKRQGLGTLARKEVIRCLMVQQRGRQVSARSTIGKTVPLEAS